MTEENKGAFAFISPDKISDPLAENLEWKSSVVAGRRGGGNFRGYKIVRESDRRLVVKPTLSLYVVLVIMSLASIGLLLGTVALAVNGEWVAAVFLALFLLLAYLVVRTVRKGLEREIAFDKASGVSGAIINGETAGRVPIPLSKVHAIQVLQPNFIAGEIHNRDWFELYLVLDDGCRAYVYSNGGNYHKFYRDAEMLSAFLNVPVWGHFPKIIAAARSVFMGVKAVVFGSIMLVSVGLIYSILNADMNGESIETPAQSFDLNPYDVVYSFDGNYETDFGYLQMRALPESTEAGALTTVVGRYATADGRFKGSAVLESPSQEFVIRGIWIQSSSGEECAEPMHGSRYWGSFRWVMTVDEEVVDPNVPGKILQQLPFSGFTGQWHYCDLGTDDASVRAGDWTGVRARDLSLLNFCEASVFALPEMEKCTS